MPLLRFKRIFYFKKIILGRVLKQLKKLPRKRRFLKKIHIMKKKPFTGLKIKKKINYRTIKKSQFFLPKPVLLSRSVDSFSKFEFYKTSTYKGYNVFNKHRTEFVKNKIKSFLILQKVTKKNSSKRLLVPKNDIFTHKKRFLAWAVKKNYNSLRKHFNEVLNPEHKVYKHARKLLRSFRGSPKKLVSKIKSKTRKARKYAYYNNFLRQIKFLKPTEDSNIKKRKHVNMPMHKLLTSFKFLDPTVFSNLTRTASSFASIFAYRKRKRLLKKHPFIRLKLSKHRFKSDRS